MTCKICGSDKTKETPHEIHGAKISCAGCEKFIRWKGKEQDPMEYYLKMEAVAKENGMKTGWAAHKFFRKFGRWPSWEEKGEQSPEVVREFRKL